MSESPSPPSSSTELRRAPAAERWRYAVLGACLGAAVTLFASAVYPSRPAPTIPPDLARDLAEATAAVAVAGAPAPPSLSAAALDAGRPARDSSTRE